MDNIFKEVRFDEYCKYCKHYRDPETGDICDDCLSNPVNAESTKPIHYDGKFVQEGHGAPSPYDSFKKIKPYLYEVTYSNLNKSVANTYFMNQVKTGISGGCSSVRNENFFGRNYDWQYDELAEFIVHTTAKPFSRHASIGVAGGFKQLTNAFVESGKKSYIYDVLPFQLIDGINDCGVICNMNVVPAVTSITPRPSGTSYQKISSLQLIRFVLDNFSSAAAAVDYISKHVTVYFPTSLKKMDYEVHYMIADSSNTFIVEFKNSHIVVLDANAQPYMTNFHISGVRFNQDGTVYTPETQDSEHDAIKTNLVHPYGSGLERYNYIVGNYSSANTKAGMRALMNGLRYTKAYASAKDVSNPYWYTEFVGSKDLTCASDPSDYTEVVTIADGYFKNRSRTDGGLTWQTVHSSVYDISEKKLYIITQEDGKEFSFSI